MRGVGALLNVLVGAPAIPAARWVAPFVEAKPDPEPIEADPEPRPIEAGPRWPARLTPHWPLTERLRANPSPCYHERCDCCRYWLSRASADQDERDRLRREVERLERPLIDRALARYSGGITEQQERQ